MATRPRWLRGTGGSAEQNNTNIASSYKAIIFTHTNSIQLYNAELPRMCLAVFLQTVVYTVPYLYTEITKKDNSLFLVFISLVQVHKINAFFSQQATLIEQMKKQYVITLKWCV